MRKVTVRTETGVEVRFYLTDDEVYKYQQLGFNVKEGPRGGHYILEEDFIAGKKKLRERRNQNKIDDNEKEKELEELLEKLKELYKAGKYKEALKIVDKIRNEFDIILDDEEFEYLYKVEDKIVRKGSDDVLGIGLCEFVSKNREYVYKRVSENLGVLSNFRKIDSIAHIGDNIYSVKLGNDKFEVKYKKNGTVEEIWYYDNGKKYKGREGIVKWLSKSKGKELGNIWKAFSKTYTSKKVGNKEIIEINRKNSLIDKIEKVEQTGRGNKKVKWMMFILVKAKELGIAVKGIDDVIKLLNSEGIKQLIMEMFSAMK